MGDVLAELERFNRSESEPGALAELCGRHPLKDPKLSHSAAERGRAEDGSRHRRSSALMPDRRRRQIVQRQLLLRHPKPLASSSDRGTDPGEIVVIGDRARSLLALRKAVHAGDTPVLLRRVGVDAVRVPAAHCSQSPQTADGHLSR